MQRYRTFYLILTVFLAGTSWVCADTQTRVEKSPILLGALLDLSSEYAMQCAAFREGAELAVEEINGAGGINGRALKVIFEDTHYNLARTHTAAVKLSSLDHVVAAIISTYTEVMTAGPVFEKAQIPLINLWDSAPEIDALGEYIFGIGQWTPSTSETAAGFARKTLRAQTAAAIGTNGEWSLNTMRDFKKSFEAGGGRFIQQLTVNPGDTDFRTVILKMKGLNPDVLYAPVADNIATFFKQLKESGFDKPIVTSDVLSEELIAVSGNTVEGVYQTQTAAPSSDSSSAKRMLELYKNKYNRDCTQILFTAWAYDAVHILAEAIRRGGVAPVQIKDELYNVHRYAGASGPIDIDQNGSSRVPASVFQIINGKLKLVEPGAATQGKS